MGVKDLAKGALTTAAKAALGIKKRMVLLDRQTRKDKVLFNAVLDYSRSYSSQISEHTIEDEKIVADHVSMQPETITLTAILTDDDISLLDVTSFFGLNNESIRDRKDRLVQWKKEAELLVLVTYDEEVDKILIESITERKSSDLGSGMSIDLTLRKVRLMGDVEVADVITQIDQLLDAGKTELGLDAKAS